MIRRLLTERESREKIAIIDNDREITYGELINRAKALLPLLPHRRENIAILLPNGSDFIAAFWGTIAAGMTAFPLNVLMTGYEIAPLLIQAHVKNIISSTAYRPLFEKIKTPSLDNHYNIIYMEELGATSGGYGFVQPDIDPDETMVLLNTSGTMGKCKIVMLSEGNVEASVLGYLDKLQPDRSEAIPRSEKKYTFRSGCRLPATDSLEGILEDVFGSEYSNIRYMLAAPFSSVYGIMILSACLLQSFPVVPINQGLTPDAFFRTAEKHRVTHYEGSTSIILMMERLIGKHMPYDISALTYFGFGGSMVSGNVIERLQNAYGEMGFYPGYGMTEASPLISKHPHTSVKKTASAGTAVKGVEISVEVDNELLRTPFREGEIVVRGPNVMRGYYNNEAETEKVLKDGYLYTGDIGYQDDEGYLYICGRKKNIINVRGLKVYPEEVEECIQGSRLAKACIVYGRTDDFGNETVCADIVPAHSEVKAEEISRYCSDRLAGYKQPGIISFCEGIERNASGKATRRKGDSP